MNDPTPPLTDAQASLELLREVVDHGARTGGYPSVQKVRADRKAELWVFDDLINAGWLAPLGDLLVPTVTGLLAADTPAAQEALEDTRAVFQFLAAAYRKDPNFWVTADFVAVPSLDPKRVPLAMLRLAVDPARFFTGGSFEAGGKLLSVNLAPGILGPFPGSVEAVSPIPADSPVSLSLEDFQGLSSVEWSPQGVSVVVGANGSGKTTLLRAFVFLRDAYELGVLEAVKRAGGPGGLRRLGSASRAVRLALTTGPVSWELRLAVTDSVHEFAGEVLKVGGNVLLRRGTYQPHWYLRGASRQADAEGRSCLHKAFLAGELPEASGVVNALANVREFVYSLAAVRAGAVEDTEARILDSACVNLRAVLRNWKAAPRRFNDQFATVLTHLRRAFPGLVEDIEFDPPSGSVIPARFYPTGHDGALPLARAADGMLVGLVHLTAVAGAPEGSIVAIDEMENQLHPHAIRAIVASIREIAEQRRLTVLLTTHSPVLMNEFRAAPDHLYVMETGRSPLPVSFDKLGDPDWLAHFEIGDLYDRLEIAAPPKVS